ncbi:transposable element Tcb1 transposase [Elysia marginata]|uniref:Transposable element Tcb1 transposase n=1 Tax=Elysia marginata TaxID=1093978 RepID=A0AAV4FSQ8_9GAST|nr:transposable element Tcb1 transposase [Elysia marginata]
MHYVETRQKPCQKPYEQLISFSFSFIASDKSPYIGSILTQRHRYQRTLWAQEHAAWDRIQWRSIVFSDESRFCIDHAGGNVRVWRRSGKRYQADCVGEHDMWGGASLMMCCCTGSPGGGGAHTLLAGPALLCN